MKPWLMPLPGKNKKICLTLARPFKTILTNKRPPALMTKNQFAALCEFYGIHPAVALEDPEVCLAIMDHDLDAVEAALQNNF